MKRHIAIISTIAVLWAMPAFALELHEARASGQVGEKADGYVAAIAKSGEVSALVSEVNAKRKAEYMRISKENGQPVDVVAKLAAQQVIGSLPSGSQYQDAGGNWQKK